MAAAAPIIIMALGTAVGVAGSIQAGKAQKAQADYNAKVAENDAIAAKQKAEYDASIHREKVAKLLSTQKALYGKSGVQSSSGSPLLVQNDTVTEGELDAQAILYGGDIEAGRSKSAASLYRMQGKQAKKASYYEAGSTLLTGAAKTMSLYNSTYRTPSARTPASQREW